MSAIWFKDGLRFACQRCGGCCTGAPGYVWVSADEATRIARFLNLSVGEFRKRYTRKVFGRISLTERGNGDCVLLEAGRLCTIYEVRPAQCRTWPFWTSNLRTPESWRATCRVCRGAGQGQLYTCEQILQMAQMVDV